MIKIGVCDDDERELSRILPLLRRYRDERGLELSLASFSSAVTLLEEMKAGEFTLLLLDILMPGLNGIQAAREIRGFDQAVKLLFLTSSPEFAVESYAVGAFHYLLKPVTAECLFPLLDKALAEIQQQEGEGLVIKGKNRLTHISFARLEYVEVISKLVNFHLTDGSVVETFGTLTEFEGELLTRPNFLKVHRSYLVNLSHVETLDRKLAVTRYGHQIPIARSLYNQVKEAYMRFLFAGKDVASGLPVQPPAPPLTVLPPEEKDLGGAYRILLVDDEADQRTYWAGILQNHGCRVSCAANGGEAAHLAAQGVWDCVLLDVRLCGESGFAIAKALRELTGAAVVFLSVLSDAESQLQGFQSGGVDYIVKDATPALFWAKVETRIRLSRAGRTQLCFEPLVLDLGERRVVLAESELIFTPIEFDLLWCLAEHTGEVYSTEALHSAVWGDSNWEDGQTVQAHMSRMRRKLEKAYPAHYFIETVWGEGYRFMPADEKMKVESF